MITLALMGDVMLGRKVAEALDRYMRPEEPWGDVMPLLDAAEVAAHASAVQRAVLTR